MQKWLVLKSPVISNLLGVENQAMKTCRGNASKGKFIWVFIFMVSAGISKGNRNSLCLNIGKGKVGIGP
jgi:hypothetical protein